IIKFEPQVDKLLELLGTEFDALTKAGQPVEFDRWFNYFAFDVLGEVTFSQPFRFLETGTDIRNAIANTRALALYISVMGHYAWLHHLTLGNPMLSRLGLQPSSHIFDTCLAALDARKQNPDVRNDMVEHWMRMQQKYPDAWPRMRFSPRQLPLSAQELIRRVLPYKPFSIIFFGILSTSNAFGRKSILRPRMDSSPRSSRTQRLRSCRTCKPVFSFLKTVLSVNPWVFHRNPELFGLDCDSFIPERWLDAGRSKKMDSFLIHVSSQLHNPFSLALLINVVQRQWGAGYNQCPGRNLAHFEISKVTATLVRDYEMEQIDPHKPWRFETHFTAVPYDWQKT
ncbi:Benzoate 4-monooxygenase cytochrome P450, partial [Rasamsonia emersonii CBS 393.64]